MIVLFLNGQGETARAQLTPTDVGADIGNDCGQWPAVCPIHLTMKGTRGITFLSVYHPLRWYGCPRRDRKGDGERGLSVRRLANATWIIRN